ncbi:vWA domain-containing protein [Shewanella youngdeokensis]|uniref:VWA domain-containing protein n=1 Tax=Shewanella youngdeokensis TaxID=2999068 RepID=A0ABZ0K2U4_9GAMM|nr:VWA domain-containing protein [Shewanella sp. DAU334]
MLEFTYPFMALLLPLPWLINYFVPAFKIQQAAIKVPFFNVIQDLLKSSPNSALQYLKPTKWQRCALICVWLLLVIAMCKPVMLGEPQTRQQVGRDLMVVVDLSGSMETTDFSITKESKGKHANQLATAEIISRLAAVKRVLSDFAMQRDGDRLGLILFGDAAYLQAPFTADHQSWLELLNEAQVGMAGQSTHIGDALGLAIKLMQPQASDKATTQKDKVVILLTDGNDTDSSVPPIEAAKIAANKEITVHVIAIGDPLTVGEQAMDMATIESIATITGGQAFQAISTSELNDVYRQISELEPANFASFTYQPKQSVHYLPIAAAIVIYLVVYVLVFFRRFIQSNKAPVTKNKQEEL